MNLIKFESIIKGLSYLDKCPICNWTLPSQGKDFVTDLNLVTGNIDINVSHLEDIKLNIYNNKMTYTKYSNISHYSTLGGGQFTTVGSSPPYTLNLSSYIFSLQKMCHNKKCYNYRYTIDIDLCMTEGKVSSVTLGSESIDINDEECLHIISKSYSMDRTYYKKYNGKNKVSKLEFPLLNLDFKQPEEAFVRIKKLLIFS